MPVFIHVKKCTGKSKNNDEVILLPYFHACGGSLMVTIKDVLWREK
jgi:hypothetical protein